MCVYACLYFAINSVVLVARIIQLQFAQAKPSSFHSINRMPKCVCIIYSVYFTHAMPKTFSKENHVIVYSQISTSISTTYHVMYAWSGGLPTIRHSLCMRIHKQTFVIFRCEIQYYLRSRHSTVSVEISAYIDLVVSLNWQRESHLTTDG